MDHISRTEYTAACPGCGADALWRTTDRKMKTSDIDRFQVDCANCDKPRGPWVPAGRGDK